MKRLICTMILVMGACAIDGTSESTAEHESESFTSWMVGTWGCATNYHTVPGFSQWTRHRVEHATYTLTPAGIGGIVRGGYAEDAPEPIDFNDTWAIGSTPINDRGDVDALYTAATSDGTLVEASGTLRRPADKAILGAEDFVGTVVLADGSTHKWIGGEIATTNGAAVKFVRNWNVEIAQDVFQDYADTICTLH